MSDFHKISAAAMATGFNARVGQGGRVTYYRGEHAIRVRYSQNHRAVTSAVRGGGGYNHHIAFRVAEYMARAARAEVTA
jgi:hypothetical protein